MWMCCCFIDWWVQLREVKDRAVCHRSLSFHSCRGEPRSCRCACSMWSWPLNSWIHYTSVYLLFHAHSTAVRTWSIKPNKAPKKRFILNVVTFCHHLSIISLSLRVFIYPCFSLFVSRIIEKAQREFELSGQVGNGLRNNWWISVMIHITLRIQDIFLKFFKYLYDSLPFSSVVLLWPFLAYIFNIFNVTQKCFQGKRFH